MTTWTPETHLLLAAAISAIPLIIAVGTCYLKFSVVLSLMKSGFGTQQAPSAALVMALSIVMSLVVMQGVLSDTATKFESIKISELSKLNMKQLVERGGELVGPWRAFLLQHSGERELIVFSRLASRERGESEEPLDRETLGLGTILGAFVVSEIKQAFVMAFFLLIPFFIIDLVVANVLVGMGLTMMSPIIVSLPLKLLLFISADGWLLLANSLIKAYQ